MQLMETQLECPICLLTLLSPITLPCGHTYCQSCIKHSYFKQKKKICPVCRQKFLININLFAVNFILDKILKDKFMSDQKYSARMKNDQSNQYIHKNNYKYELIKKWIKIAYPWVIILLLLYHLIRFKINVFYMLMEKYKSKALSIAQEIKKENSLDFKFFLFSQFMRILFSNIAIP